MNTLCALAEKYGSDKTPSILHNYTPFYAALFSKLTVHRVLEIGILNGASLRMWRDYFPSAQIVGLEINPDVLFQSDRIHTVQCDASNRDELISTLEKLGGRFDLIIDDASHVPTDQVLVGNTLPDYLAPGGVMVIEDVGQDDVSSEILTPHLFVRTSSITQDDQLIVITR